MSINLTHLLSLHQLDSPGILRCDCSTPQHQDSEQLTAKTTVKTTCSFTQINKVMEIHASAVILLLILAASFTAYGDEQPPPDINPRYQKFLSQHVGLRVSEHACDREIRKRDITASGTENGCKEVNTFIKAKKDIIRVVCGKGGTPQGKNLFKSNKPFPVVTCKLKSGQRHPNCQYRGKKSTRYIVLGCDRGWPVHYEEGII
ncbi:ribonuclease-like 3 [Carassius auratus]|uniref:Ribonuclease-like 3 n=1 Tax=Carassius auratus TaxID=7957 RepID=A0A6P6J5K6_CARAU|nr:ribonuclease-like 3 [Carassius auratus]